MPPADRFDTADSGASSSTTAGAIGAGVGSVGSTPRVARGATTGATTGVATRVPSAVTQAAPDEPMADSDEALMVRYAQGDVPAFERLYDRHEAPVYRFLLRSVGIAALADDLLQDVWLSVIRSADRYEARALFTT